MQINQASAIIKSVLDFFKNIGPSELIIVAIVIIVLFGSRMLVGMSRKLGESTKEINKVRKELKTIKEEVA
ncbi:MAG: twin-arginine translocase TatA/TatE family subunit [bacterium]|nr:twin-arginine translocase TatA/TatE family subunit [bacterium]